MIATAALRGPTPAGTLLYRVLGCGFVLCLVPLAFLSPGTPVGVRVATATARGWHCGAAAPRSRPVAEEETPED